jgi:hypothetical protein
MIWGALGVPEEQRFVLGQKFRNDKRYGHQRKPLKI